MPLLVPLLVPLLISFLSPLLWPLLPPPQASIEIGAVVYGLGLLATAFAKTPSFLVYSVRATVV